VRALDANVLARVLIDDPDDEQAAKLRPAAIAALSEAAFVPVTVVLELEWVMRGFYGLPPADFVRVVTALAGVEHVQIEDRGAVLAAIDAHARGIDFADALHLARSARASGFATFDKRLATRAAALALTPAVELLA